MVQSKYLDDENVVMNFGIELGQKDHQQMNQGSGLDCGYLKFSEWFWHLLG